MRTTTISEGIAGLILWDELDDPYDHGQLAGNWVSIAGHDHTDGNGNIITTPAIADHAVTHDKLAPDSVDSSNIVDGSIQTVDIADEAITAPKIEQSLFHKIIPLGSVLMWWRPNTSVQPPEGWVICAGQPVTDHDFGAGVTVRAPDFKDRFIVGAGGSIATNEKVESDLTRNQVRTSTHHHGFSYAHTHSIGANTFYHAHSIGNHSHSVDGSRVYTNYNGDHNHGFGKPGDWHTLGQATMEMYHDEMSPHRCLYVYNFTGTDVDMRDRGEHRHYVDVPDRSTSANGAGGTSAYEHGAVGVGGQNVSSGNTSDATITVDIIPAYIGMLFIMKVKKPR